MKRVYLKCVYKRNLGDDIFIKILCDRYKQNFMTLNFKDGYIYPKIDNLKSIKVNFNFYRLFRKISTITGKRNLLETLMIKLFGKDLIVGIGGSVFMEPKDYLETNKSDGIYWYENLKNFHVIGANIGPVYSEKYIEDLKSKVIVNAADVCLRDKESFNYIKDLKNVRYAPDIVFSLDVDKYKNIKEEKKVIISVIDLIKKASQIKNPNLLKYEDCIDDIINYFIENNYKVELMSFCKEEGDETAIKRILENSKYKDQVSVYLYDGNIDEALKELASAKVLVGTRFHANIIGMILNKSILPIIYNDKTRNLLKDLKYKGKSIDIDDIDNFNIKDFKLKDFDYKCDVSKEISLSQNHFKELDKILERKGDKDV